MPRWVEISEQFDWVAPNGRSMKSYPPGPHFMPTDHADAAEAQGKGVTTDKPAGKKTTKAGGVADAD